MLKKFLARRDRPLISEQAIADQRAPRVIPARAASDAAAAFQESLRTFTREHSQRPADTEPWIELTPAGRAALAKAAAHQAHGGDRS